MPQPTHKLSGTLTAKIHPRSRLEKRVTMENHVIDDVSLCASAFHEYKSLYSNRPVPPPTARVWLVRLVRLVPAWTPDAES